MSKWKSLADIRRQYGNLALNEANLQISPFAQFESWFEQVLQTETSDPTAMVLSTIDPNGYPDSRVVLLKGIEQNAFVFYTNYHSKKAQQLDHLPHAALNFYWPEMARQVRIRGRVEKTSVQQSDDYFSSRPSLSQLSAISSPQSQEVSSRDELELRLNKLITAHQQKPVMRPEYWGGYVVVPTEFEFWQGRDNRLHDRIHYFLQNGQWIHRRLAP